MKIAFISNQNHFFYSIVRYLRDRGLDVDLLLLASESEELNYRYHPKTDSFDDSYKKFTKQLTWGGVNNDLSNLKIRRQLKKNIKESLKEYDFIAGGFIAPAYLAFAGIKNDLFLPLGQDARTLPFYTTKYGYITFNIRAYYQKKGIRNSKYIINGINAIREITLLKPKGEVISYPIPTVYNKLLDTNISDTTHDHKVEFLTKINNLKKENYFLLFSQKRQNWTDTKGDTHIKAFAKFIYEFDGKAKLLLIHNGTDVENANKLIKSLNIENHIEWIPMTCRFDILKLINIVNMCIADTFKGYKIPGLPATPTMQSGSSFETIAMGKPMIMGRDIPFIRRHFANPPPFCIANDIDEIYQHLLGYVDNPDKYKEIGKLGKLWHKKVIETDTIDLIIDLIEGNILSFKK
jgi:hypothetical protein